MLGHWPSSSDVCQVETLSPSLNVLNITLKPWEDVISSTCLASLQVCWERQTQKVHKIVFENRKVKLQGDSWLKMAQLVSVWSRKSQKKGSIWWNKNCRLTKTISRVTIHWLPWANCTTLRIASIKIFNNKDNVSLDLLTYTLKLPS